MKVLFLSFVFIYYSLSAIAQQPSPKVVLVTGSSSGIGWATAKELALQGHHVYATMRHLQVMSEPLPPSLYLLQLDVTDDASIIKALDVILDQHGRLDVLFNNAGCAVFGPLETIDIDQAKHVFEVNVFGTMRMMQAVLPIMRQQGRGLIINMSSTSGVRPSPGWDVYAASKFAIEGLSEATAAMARFWNIDIVLLEPGATATEFMTKSTEIGSRRTSHTECYDYFVPNALRWMQERLDEGQKPTDVAQIVLKIISNDYHWLRYQTSPKGEKTVASRHCDPTGETSVQEQALLIRQLWQGLLDPKIGSSYR